MHHRMLSAAIAVLCLSAAAFAQTRTLRVAGVTRNYILHVPSGLEKPPLVFVLHGFNMSGQQEVGLTRMNQVADREKFIVAYPNALPRETGEQSWKMTIPNDYDFLLAIIDTVDAAYSIDRKRVYASGFSQGGFLSFQLGCRYADVFAAIAPVSGMLNDPAGCSPKRPVPMIFTFGTNEGLSLDGFLQSGRDWARINGCNATPTVVDPYPAGNPNSVVTRSIYGSCKEGAEVVVQTVEGGGHEWPMNTQTKVNNSEEIWAFFKKHSLAAPTALHRREGRTSAGTVRAETAGGKIRLRGKGPESAVRVLDTRGRELATEVTDGSRSAIR